MTAYHLFTGPQRYVQGVGLLAEAGLFIRPLGAVAYVLHGGHSAELWNRHLHPALARAGIRACGDGRAGACTEREIGRAAIAARTIRAEVIVGLGSGTVADIAKAVAVALDLPSVIVPTLASSAAPALAESAILPEGGAVGTRRPHRRGPDLVLVDTQVIADAPVRPFVAGIGDALATWFAARAVAKSYATTPAGGWPTVAAGALARACWETLRRHAPEAIAAVRAHRVTDAVEKTVEAIILLNGLGRAGGGMAAAHAIRNGLTTLPATDALWHGEKIAFGVLVQLELERHITHDHRDVLRFCLQVGLPVCFADLGMPEVTPAQIAAIAERALAAGEAIHNEPRALTPEAVVEALQSADARGRVARAAPVAA